MKYIFQLAWIAGVCMVSEILHGVIDLSIPASVYGLAIMLVLLTTKVIKLGDIEDVADFLVKIMPIFFVSPMVGIIEAVVDIKGQIVSLLVISIVSTVVTFFVTGTVAQLLLFLTKKKGEKDE